LDTSNFSGKIKKTFSRIKFVDNFLLNIKRHLYKEIYGEDTIVYRNFVDEPAYYLRISWGCLANCAYCAIKKGVEPHHSKAFDQCIKEFQKGLKEGYKKFHITGDNVTFYGVDIGSSFIELLDEITSTPGDFQIFIQHISGGWITKHVDDFERILKRNKIRNMSVAIQSGSGHVLKLMNRYSDAEKMKQVLSRLRKNHPEIIFNSLYIVGFPAESEEDFHDTLSFIKIIDFTDGNIFSFSLKTGTKAEEIEPKIPQETISDRMDYAKQYLKSIGYKVRYNPNPSFFMFYKKKD
jgi:threonylcarbamoyladenosine tRNA methylthiotransferase MtaB